MASLQVRIPPHSTEAEESVLGALLLDKDAIIAIAEFLRAEDFYDERHSDIYTAAIELYEERVPIDVLTISERLKKRKVLKRIGGASYLVDLANQVPTAAHVEHYGKIVKDAATKRALMKAASRLVELSMDEGLAAAELLDKAEFEVFSLTQTHVGKSFIAVREALAESFDRLDELHKQSEGLRGVPTGFADLDSALAGFQKSNLIILAGRPGTGKTSLALNFAEHITVKYKRPVGFFSLEMSKEELVDRLLVSQADIDAWRLKTGKLGDEDFTKLSNAMGVLAEAPLYIDDTPGMSILEMRTKARRLQVEKGVDLIIVDYLQLAHSRNLENRVQEVSELPINYHLGVWYMAFISGNLAYFLYVRGQRTIETSEAILFNYLQPVFTIPLAIFWLGESLTPIYIIGGIIIAIGLGIAEHKKKRYNSKSP